MALESRRLQVLRELVVTIPLIGFDELPLCAAEVAARLVVREDELLLEFQACERPGADVRECSVLVLNRLMSYVESSALLKLKLIVIY